MNTMIEVDTDVGFTIPFTGNRFCGPAALAYVMRTDPGTAARLLRSVSGRRQITGTALKHMGDVLKKVGITWEEVVASPRVPLRKRLTLRNWYYATTPLPDEEYIVNITGHYLVVHGKRYFDSRCHLGKPIEKCPWLNSTVKVVWKVMGTARIPEALER